MQISIAFIGLSLLLASMSNASPVPPGQAVSPAAPSGSPVAPLSRRAQSNGAPAGTEKDAKAPNNKVDEAKKAMDAQADTTKTEYRKFVDEEEKLAKSVGDFKKAKIESYQKPKSKRHVPVVVVQQSPITTEDNKKKASDVENAKKAFASAQSNTKADIRKAADGVEKTAQAKVHLASTQGRAANLLAPPSNSSNKKDDKKDDKKADKKSDKKDDKKDDKPPSNKIDKEDKSSSKKDDKSSSKQDDK